MAFHLPLLGAFSGGLALFFLLPSKTRYERRSVQVLPGWLDDLVHAVGSSRLGAFLAGRPSVEVVSEDLGIRLARFGIALGSEGCVGMLVVLCVATVFAACVIGASPVAGGVAFAAELVGIPLLAASSTRKRMRALAREMPQVFRTLASALGSGESLSQAIAYVGLHEKGRAAEEFARASLRLRCGVGSREVLRELSQRLDAPGVRLLTSALAISQRTGSSLDGLLQRSAVMVERQEELSRLLSVKTAQARLSVRIVCVMPALMVGVLSLFSQDFQRGLTTFQGLACVAVALVMDLAALVVIRSLMKGVL